ncbi:F-box-like/WD repeat-containing protein TBL1XR1 isoform X2 [Gigaspora margarita]|uniref:F-box-like/WD repeat-containing protein TBL1XR1 isoform X2 n=1 Tax=Gigaspora margarita TaxID=4874 RepID=A0A8H3WY35_GIGMA|nr:F-box-like/WD repeat-containing protein TBL1XR1 isoform X2 [Gigaspora margarita]
MPVRSEEIDYLIYRYLLEHNYAHSAFVFNTEANVEKNAAAQKLDIGSVKRDALVLTIRRAMLYKDLVYHTPLHGPMINCKAELNLIGKHICDVVLPDNESTEESNTNSPDGDSPPHGPNEVQRDNNNDNNIENRGNNNNSSTSNGNNHNTSKSSGSGNLKPFISEGEVDVRNDFVSSKSDRDLHPPHSDHIPDSVSSQRRKRIRRNSESVRNEIIQSNAGSSMKSLKVSKIDDSKSDISRRKKSKNNDDDMKSTSDADSIHSQDDPPESSKKPITTRGRKKSQQKSVAFGSKIIVKKSKPLRSRNDQDSVSSKGDDDSSKLDDFHRSITTPKDKGKLVQNFNNNLDEKSDFNLIFGTQSSLKDKKIKLYDDDSHCDPHTIYSDSYDPETLIDDMEIDSPQNIPSPSSVIRNIPHPNRTFHQKPLIYKVDDKSHTLLNNLLRQGEEFMTCAWKPGDYVLATGGRDGKVRIWKDINGDATNTWKNVMSTTYHLITSHDPIVTWVEWTVKGDMIACSYDTGIAGVYRDDCIFRRKLDGHKSSVSKIKWSPKGDYLATVSCDVNNLILLWDLDGNYSRLDDLHKKTVTDVAWNDNALASCSSDGKVILWKLSSINDKLEIRPFEYAGHDGEVFSIQWDPTKNYLASCARDGTCKIWSNEKRDPLQTISSKDGDITLAKWHPKSTTEQHWLLTTSKDSGIVRFWDALEPRCWHNIHLHQSHINTIEFSPDGRYFASGSKDSFLNIVDVKTYLTVETHCLGNDIMSIEWNHKSTQIAARLHNGNVYVVMVLDVKKKST